MRHVLATIAVLLIALAGFHYWNGQQTAAFDAAKEQAETLASKGDLIGALNALNKVDIQRMSPGVRGKAAVERLELREHLVKQVGGTLQRQLSAGQFGLAETTLAELKAHLPPDRVQVMRDTLGQRRLTLQRLRSALPEFSGELDQHWDEIADALAAWNATLRNPFKRHREHVENLIWNASPLSSHVESQAREEKKLADLQDDIANWRTALPNAPERSLPPFWTSRKTLEKKIAAAEKERTEVQAAWGKHETRITDTLKTWTVAEPDRVRNGDEIRALHRIVVLPEWLARCAEKLPEPEAVEAQEKLLECLRSAVKHLADEQGLKTTVEVPTFPVENPVGLSEAVRAAMVGSDD